jgi:hypothetical protein
MRRVKRSEFSIGRRSHPLFAPTKSEPMRRCSGRNAYSNGGGKQKLQLMSREIRLILAAQRTGQHKGKFERSFK